MVWFMCSFGETYVCASYANKNLESWILFRRYKKWFKNGQFEGHIIFHRLKCAEINDMQILAEPLWI